MTYLSADGEEGLPGAVIATTIFQLTADNRFVIVWKAAVTKPTLVNISTHCYFNVAGHVSEILNNTIKTCISIDICLVNIL